MPSGEALCFAVLLAPVVASVMILILERAVAGWTPGPAAFNAGWMSNGTRAASSVRTHRRGCYQHLLRTQLCLECYCACRRHLRCHLERTETSVYPRFTSSSRISHCLALHGDMGMPDIKHNRDREINGEHLLAVQRGRDLRAGSTPAVNYTRECPLRAPAKNAQNYFSLSSAPTSKGGDRFFLFQAKRSASTTTRCICPFHSRPRTVPDRRSAIRRGRGDCRLSRHQRVAGRRHHHSALIAISQGLSFTCRTAHQEGRYGHALVSTSSRSVRQSRGSGAAIRTRASRMVSQRCQFVSKRVPAQSAKRRRWWAATTAPQPNARS
jgi:hypothetical protein